MFAGLSMAALGTALLDLGKEVAHLVLRVMLFLAVMALIWPLLPNDPFRDTLIDFAVTLAPYAHWINLVAPVPFIASASPFYAAYRYAFFCYRKASVIALRNSNITFGA